MAIRGKVIFFKQSFIEGVDKVQSPVQLHRGSGDLISQLIPNELKNSAIDQIPVGNDSGFQVWYNVSSLQIVGKIWACGM